MVTGRFAKFWGRRRLLALAGLGAGSAVQAAFGSDRTAHATQVVGTNNYSGSTDTSADGVQGYASGASNAGTFGRNNDLNGVGIFGTAPSGTGAYGESGTGTGVGAKSASGTGLFAVSDSGFGVHAASSLGHAVYGHSAGTGAAGIFGQADVSTAAAGVFIGTVAINGDFTVYGQKNAAVPHPNGGYRRLYCQEAPEPWFEDFGEGQLVGGRATVALDSEFSGVVRTDGYHVFLTAMGDCRGLYVASRSQTGFEVRELQAGTSSLAFSYRIVARRKDIAGPRLERVSAPPAALPIGGTPGNPGDGSLPSRTPTPGTSGTPSVPTATPTPSPSAM